MKRSNSWMSTSKSLKILEARSSQQKKKFPPGKVFLTDGGELAVGTGQNCLILQKLQLEGKDAVSAREFLNGHREIIGTTLK